ncbi:sensor histidine kinase [Robertmurraya korlensis]|uniref:sensor histidine kinase n=1 Tax=Robertmurraya korlensis TaxID=519977 RepID=UPI0008262B11|nr:HAMP domain-containing sensor histidine kinase [Robertmurraya korlensis]
MEITKHFFFNLSLLMVILFFALVWSAKMRNFSISKRFSLFWGILLLWTCFQFSYHPVPDILMDLRELPVLIGGLYLGIGPILSIMVIFIRGLYGIDAGFFANIGLYLPLAFFFWKVYPWFWNQRPSRRVVISILLGIAISIITLSSLGFMNLDINLFDAYIAYLVVPNLGIAMISITSEFVIKNFHLQNQLIKSGKLEVVEQMGAAISHEIRNPLTSAKGFVQLLLEGPQTSQKHTEYLKIISHELILAEQVIKDYLTFSKPSLEQVEPIEVSKELTLIIKMLIPTANQYSVKVNTQIETQGHIIGDRLKFHQCFLNVIKNGIESMPNGGQLLILSDTSEKNVTISVIDHGVGMTKEQLDRLGEPYYSTKGSKGTGLGMMVAYSIVKAMNGVIRVQSELGKGTTFRFIFPSMADLRDYVPSKTSNAIK